jgi:hypothetical protein
MKEVHPEISAACGRADEGLWAAFARSRGREIDASQTGKLLFPVYRGGGLRVSEQEARFAFVEALATGPLTYSVETPTSKMYQFTGKSPLSAQTDLAIHDEAGARICNVEFKAKGVSPSAEKHFPIYKDLQKLMREPLWGLWFHLLERVDNPPHCFHSILRDFTETEAVNICKVMLSIDISISCCHSKPSYCLALAR